MKPIASLIFLLSIIGAPASAQWRQVQSPEIGNRSVYGLASNANYLFVGSSDNNLLRSSDNGLTWQSLLPGLSNRSKDYILYEHKGKLLAGMRSDVPVSSAYVSIDNGEHWDSIKQGNLPHAIRANGFYVDENDTIYICGQEGAGILRENGWSSISITSLDDFVFNSIASKSGVIYINGAGVYRSKDHGRTWDTLTKQFPRVSSHGLYVADDYIVAGLKSIFYRTVDMGQNWTPVLSSSGVNFTTNFFQAIGKTLFAGTYTGVWRSTDDGQSWTTVNDSLPFDNKTFVVYSMTVRDGMVFIGTDGHGLWKRPISELLPPADVAVTGRSVATVNLSQSYPNPAVQDITIDYALPREESITLKLYDSYLNEITTLAEGRQEAGQHRVTADVRSLSSGVYFYRLTAGSMTITQRMLVTR